MVRNDSVLADELRKQLLGAPEPRSVAAVNAENTRAMAASLAELQQHYHSNIGRVAYNTVLAAAAGGGRHTCCPDSPCDPANCCPPCEPEGGVTLTDRARSLGVRAETFRDAHVRMHQTDHSIPPPQALEQGRYCWATRKIRSDATDQRVLDLARRFWHTDDVSRASGDSGEDV